MRKRKLIAMLALLMTAATGAWAQSTYKVTVKQGTEDATKWEISPAEATTTGVAKGMTVTAAYGGDLKVKSVKAVKAVKTDIITVFFTDVLNWGTPNIYYWDGGAAWPGTPMTYVEENDYLQNVYRADIPADVKGIIFNGKGYQTVNITTNIADGAWWYAIDEKEGSNYKVNSSHIPDIVVTPGEGNSWSFEMPYYDVELEMEYPRATITTAPTAAEGVIAGTDVALVTGGVAMGGTLMYAVTSNNQATAPALSEFSATVPTAAELSAANYYVWYYVQGDNEHNNSEVASPVEVTVNYPTTYYVVGTMTDSDWSINTAYQLQPNTETEGEYYIHDMALTTGTKLKVVSSTDNGASIQYWYPNNTDNEYSITSTATYSIYFRPDGQGGNGWHYGVIYVQETTATLTLDEAADNSGILNDLNGKTADITLTRTLVAGSWNTFAVPFAISSSDLTSLGITAKKLASSSLTDGTLTLNFDDATSIEAGNPYLVKVANNLNLGGVVFDGVEVSKTPVTVSTTAVNFIPTLGKTTIEGVAKEKVLFVAAGNTLKNPSAMPTDMKGFRAYFQLKDDEDPEHGTGTVRSFVLNLGDEETGISATQNDNGQMTNDNVYDLQGRRISSAAQKGIYIVNGKKVIK